MPHVFFPFLLLIAWFGASAVQASDWPDPEKAWLAAPDNFVWPSQSSELDLTEMPFASLNAQLGGLLDGGLEAEVPPPTLRAAWLDLNPDGSPALLYVDPALSGTGGKYMRVVAKRDGQWAWVAELLCNRVYVSQQANNGWRYITCVGQRGPRYQRHLFVMGAEQYDVVRKEVHDVMKKTVEVSIEAQTP